jgi:hypothetical protein
MVLKGKVRLPFPLVSFPFWLSTKITLLDELTVFMIGTPPLTGTEGTSDWVIFTLVKSVLVVVDFVRVVVVVETQNVQPCLSTPAAVTDRTKSPSGSKFKLSLALLVILHCRIGESPFKGESTAKSIRYRAALS